MEASSSTSISNNTIDTLFIRYKDELKNFTRWYNYFGRYRDASIDILRKINTSKHTTSGEKLLLLCNFLCEVNIDDTNSTLYKLRLNLFNEIKRLFNENFSAELSESLYYHFYTMDVNPQLTNHILCNKRNRNSKFLFEMLEPYNQDDSGDKLLASLEKLNIEQLKAVFFMEDEKGNNLLLKSASLTNDLFPNLLKFFNKLLPESQNKILKHQNNEGIHLLMKMGGNNQDILNTVFNLIKSDKNLIRKLFSKVQDNGWGLLFYASISRIPGYFNKIKALYLQLNKQDQINVLKNLGPGQSTALLYAIQSNNNEAITFLTEQYRDNGLLDINLILPGLTYSVSISNLIPIIDVILKQPVDDASIASSSTGNHNQEDNNMVTTQLIDSILNAAIGYNSKKIKNDQALAEFLKDKLQNEPTIFSKLRDKNNLVDVIFNVVDRDVILLLNQPEILHAMDTDTLKKIISKTQNLLNKQYVQKSSNRTLLIELQKSAYRHSLYVNKEGKNLAKVRWQAIERLVNFDPDMKKTSAYPLITLKPGSGMPGDVSYWAEKHHLGHVKLLAWLKGEEKMEDLSFDQVLGYKDNLNLHDVPYLSPGEGANAIVEVKDGKLYHNDRLIDVKLCRYPTIEANTVLFVITKDGKFLISAPESENPHSFRRVHGSFFHHSSLTKGESVICAGSMSIKKGLINLITNDSGHYRPDSKQLYHGLNWLKEHGVDLSTTEVSDQRPLSPFAERIVEPVDKFMERFEQHESHPGSSAPGSSSN